ncbi:GH32 C-terminal domain-containing protein, partial [Escherichia coli]|nr:GH32 C-terminal domain-containing protein [Escherichia coli]ELM7949560.1 GH32 C-terminal domain-containing protein [Escherichia coli]ELM7959255.1 GH32 C-terminal domain-containing protein [Escherichia coli]ELM7992450.1 GH32 C-terminal domain-containing protein [Escherichia coli]ELM8030231.1 GH32 C-terminal domain-containing protein [Escherichia coli]
DAGFEFYAPQTMLTSDGRRLLVGWMGVPEGEEMLQPTLTNGWIHQMTCLRELEFIDGQLYQRPLRELSALRGEAHGWAGNSLPLAPMEIVLQTTGDDILSLDFDGALILERDASGIRLARPSLASDEKHYRYWRGDVRSLHIFIDQSSVEIFINGGEGVMSCRYFPACSGQLMFSGITPDAFCYWPLRTCMVE